MEMILSSITGACIYFSNFQECNLRFPISHPFTVTSGAPPPTPLFLSATLFLDHQLPWFRLLIVTQSSFGFCCHPENSDSHKLCLCDIFSFHSHSRHLGSSFRSSGQLQWSFNWSPCFQICPSLQTLLSSTLPKAHCDLSFVIFNHPSLPGVPDTSAPAWQSRWPTICQNLALFHYSLVKPVHIEHSRQMTCELSTTSCTLLPHALRVPPVLFQLSPKPSSRRLS